MARDLYRTPTYSSWQAQLRRTSFSQVAANNPAFTWAPRYSTVAGSLPLDAVPIFKIRDENVGFARCEINVTTPGKITFRLNSPTGLEIRIDGVPVEPGVEFSRSLVAGIHTITVTIDTGKRTDPLQLELRDIAEDGNAELVNY